MIRKVLVILTAVLAAVIAIVFLGSEFRLRKKYFATGGGCTRAER
jgi:hypothetical protein